MSKHQVCNQLITLNDYMTANSRGGPIHAFPSCRLVALRNLSLPTPPVASIALRNYYHRQGVFLAVRVLEFPTGNLNFSQEIFIKFKMHVVK